MVAASASFFGSLSFVMKWVQQVGPSHALFRQLALIGSCSHPRANYPQGMGTCVWCEPIRAWPGSLEWFQPHPFPKPYAETVSVDEGT